MASLYVIFVTFQPNILKPHDQPEDNLYAYHNVTVQHEETFNGEERIVTPRTVCALPSKSLPEMQQRHQGHCLIDGWPCKQMFPMVFTTKQSQKKMSVGLL